MLMEFRIILVWLAVAVVVAIGLGGLVAGFWPLIAELFTSDYWIKPAKVAMSEGLRNYGLIIVALVALPLAIWRAKTADRQADSASKQTDIANEQARIAERGHFTDRFSRAVDNMASPQMAIRVGGIYALFQLAEEAEGADYKSAMDMLCAFVRSAPEIKESSDGAFRADVQEILSRLFETGTESLCRVGYDINLSGGDLTWADLSGADLSEANLNGADLYFANLSDAVLGNVRSLTQDQLNAVRPTPPPESLPDGLSWQFINTNGFWGRDLRRANFSGDNLSRARLSYANLFEANLFEANLSGADLREANLREANLSGANLFEANLREADLREANLSGANLREANLREADLREANLSGADFLSAKGAPDLSNSYADPDNPPIYLPNDAKRPAVWKLCPREEED